jgi:hypothetical protein
MPVGGFLASRSDDPRFHANLSRDRAGRVFAANRSDLNVKEGNLVKSKFPSLEMAGGKFRSADVALDPHDGTDQQNAQERANNDQGASRTSAATI